MVMSDLFMGSRNTSSIACVSGWVFRSRFAFGALFSFLLLASCAELRAQTQDISGKSSQAAANTAAPAQTPGANSSAEVSTHDTTPVFRVHVNLVLVRVVVRDEKGQILTNLKKEDFQLFDNRKPQTISAFSVETPKSHAVRPVTAAPGESVSSEEASAIAPVVGLPGRFVAMVFDDVHLKLEDTNFVRNAATRFIKAMTPSDRVGIYTTSGQITQEFTDDQNALQKKLFALTPRHLAGQGYASCPDMSYFQADLIQNKHDSQALAVATEEALICAYNGDRQLLDAAQNVALGEASRTLSEGDADSEYSYRHLEDTVRRLSAMPGQRVMVLVSPGFIPSSLWPEMSQLVDRATRANVVINTIDSRGLYTPDLGSLTDPRPVAVQTLGYKQTYRVAAQSAQEEVLTTLAYGTGGRFFHNRNDIDVGMEEAGSAPPVSYVLGFSPQNMKIDGRYHTLKVAMAGKQKVSIQARPGYYAPKMLPDPAENVKQEIAEAVFSQEEIRDLPIELQTQFFKKDPVAAQLAVLTRLDVKSIRFRKAEGRNLDNLTIATVIFDENGHFVTGNEKTVEMKLLDTTYDRLSRSGLTVKSSFDVKPGTYMVRLVVRDGEGEQMAARNGAVVIPY